MVGNELDHIVSEYGAEVALNVVTKLYIGYIVPLSTKYSPW